MKKLISVLIMLCIIVSVSMPLCAAEGPYSIVDDAHILNESELSDLMNKFDNIRSEYNVDIVFVSTDALYNSAGVDASAHAYFDDHNRGYGDNRDGIMLYISMDERDYCFLVNGYADTVFSGSNFDYLENEVLSYLSSNDFAGAVNAFADVCDEVFYQAKNEDFYNNEAYDDYNFSFNFSVDDYNYSNNIGGYASKDTFSVVMTYIIAFAVAVFVAFLLTYNKVKQMKTAVKNNSANNYIKQGSFNIQFSKDIYLFSNVTKTPKPKQTSSSSRSSGGGFSGGGSGGRSTRSGKF